MGARNKLNAAHVTGSLLLAGLVGVGAGSWAVFAVCFGALTVIDLIAGNIRPGRRGR